jgi:hypothetical protein
MRNVKRLKSSSQNRRRPYICVSFFYTFKIKTLRQVFFKTSLWVRMKEKKETQKASGRLYWCLESECLSRCNFETKNNNWCKEIHLCSVPYTFFDTWISHLNYLQWGDSMKIKKHQNFILIHLFSDFFTEELERLVAIYAL